MGAITFATALLLLVSGALKVRSGRRVGTGFSPLVLGELLLGALILVVAATSALSVELIPRWLLPVGVGLVFVSTAEHASRLKKRRLAREESEAGRLHAYVKYLSQASEPEPDVDPFG
ncbi:MAG: hypothetical protein AAF389_04420 [Gemmatimonadota bacterium]